MNVFYEEEGGFKVGAILADNATSLQVEAPHGKRSKIKASAVLLRFDTPPLSAFMEAAQCAADGIDVDFLWQCCGPDEFAFDALGREYFGHAPGALEAAGEDTAYTAMSNTRRLAAPIRCKVRRCITTSWG